MDDRTNGTLAALATVPGREGALEQCLESLRPQVDRIHVVCHDMAEAPACVTRLADEWACEPDTQGSAAKLRWASSHDGLYLACDDDWHYPADYAAVMRGWVARWKGRALVTCHGRILKPRSCDFFDAFAFWPPRATNTGGWINYPGGCALAFDTALGVPSQVPGKNLEEAHLAVWAQLRRVPIWLVPHDEDFLGYLLDGPVEVPTIWSAGKARRFPDRAAVLATIGKRGGWKVHTC